MAFSIQVNYKEERLLQKGPEMEAIYSMFGPRNRPWVKTWIHDTLEELGITDVTDSHVRVIERVLSRLMPVPPGTPLGLLIAFEVSKTTSQRALSSGHILDSMAVDEATDDVLGHSFKASLSFTGIISQRKCKEANFISCTFKPGFRPPWPEVEPAIYAVPPKHISGAVSAAEHIQFITQPYTFENEFIGLISTMNMYQYLAHRDQLDELLPLFHILALVACECNPPAAYTRHGLKRRHVDFVNRSAFEDVMMAMTDACLDRETVTSESITGALLTASKSRIGTHYFDLIMPFTSPPPSVGTDQTVPESAALSASPILS